MNTLQQIEQTYNFKYPALYHQLFEDKMLDWKHCSPKKWIEFVYPKLKKTPPLLLYGYEFEVMSFSDISKQIDDFANPKSCWGFSSSHFFVPFATDWLRDYFCFFFDEENPKEEPIIVFLCYDCIEGTFIANNLQEFIFYGLLYAVFDVENHSLIHNSDFYENIHNMFCTHRPYLTDEQAEVIQEIYERKLFKHIYRYGNNGRGGQWSKECIGLISREEFETLRDKFIPIPKEW
ncbi:MAG: SMI1/KNR4 family protein [Capnocytophaga sp.]|nr:SMI1/KNR4 family protein [Capnocytophaga sp.]